MNFCYASYTWLGNGKLASLQVVFLMQLFSLIVIDFFEYRTRTLSLNWLRSLYLQVYKKAVVLCTWLFHLIILDDIGAIVVKNRNK